MSDDAHPFHLKKLSFGNILFLLFLVSSTNMKMETGSDVIFHFVLIRVCRLEAWDENFGKLIHYGSEGVNVGDMYTTDGGADASNISHNHIEVVKTNMTFLLDMSMANQLEAKKSALRIESVTSAM